MVIKQNIIDAVNLAQSKVVEFIHEHPNDIDDIYSINISLCKHDVCVEIELNTDYRDIGGFEESTRKSYKQEIKNNLW